MVNHFTSYSVEDRSYVAFVRRELHNKVVGGTFPKSRIAEIDIILAELTSNIIKHAETGEVLSRFVTRDNESSLEVVVIDNGPGIDDVARMMRDGVSTSNTLGHGLGAIQRLSDVFQMYSLPNWGTISYMQVATPGLRAVKSEFDVRSFFVPKPREVECGDGYSIKKTPDGWMVFFGDGLGHGQFAAEAVGRAARFFMECEEVDPVEMVRAMHNEVRKTRGLVGTVAVLNKQLRQWRICGVGNILTRLYGGMMFKHYLSYNGIIGLNIPNTMNATILEAERNQQLIMCSDGIRTRWDLTRYPAIMKFDNMLLAAALYKDFTRRNDDASVLIAKVNFER